MSFSQHKAMISSLFLSSLLLMTGCMTGSTLRTARVLEKGQFEISGGMVGIESGVAQVVIGAYGITDRLEIEGRWEDRYGAITPRFQLLESESAPVDALAFFELGYSGSRGFQGGPGAMVGRRWKWIEPYVSYRFRHFQKTNSWLGTFSQENNYQYLKFGSRFYLPSRREPNPSSFQWFLTAEVGPTFFSGSDYLFEWAANFGFDY